MFTVERMRRDDLKRSRWACAACEREGRTTYQGSAMHVSLCQGITLNLMGRLVHAEA